MNIKKALVYLTFTLFFVTASSVHAAGTDSRYFIKSTSQFWKKSFQVRNVFDTGFTADLNDWQLKLTKVFGVEVIPVKKLNILATITVSKKTTTRPLIKIPLNQVGWGVKAIYGETLKGESPSGGEGVNVALLDTGVLINHPDLKGRIIVCSDFTGSEPFTKNSCDDKNGHGTQVAGVIAANGGPEGKGMFGVAPDTKLIIYKVCANDGTCFSDDVASAIRRAVDSEANIIVLSFGSDVVSSIINDAITYATDHDILIIAAAGNDGPYTGSIDYPSSNEFVVSVGVVDAYLTVPDWSARGTNTASSSFTKQSRDLEFVAPGVNVESTSNNNDYVTSSGSSMAAAHVAGLAAKEWQGDAEHPASATRNLLHKFSLDILPIGNDITSGWGMPQL